MRTSPSAVMESIGPFEFTRTLVRGPGVLLAEGRDADGGRRLLQLIALSPRQAAAETFDAVERGAALRTAAVTAETGREEIQAHGSAARADGGRTLYWALRWDPALDADPSIAPESFAEWSSVAEFVAGWLVDRHARALVHPLLSRALIRLHRPSSGLELNIVGVPVAVEARWLADDVDPPPTAPGEKDATAATPAGDLWRFGCLLAELGEGVALPAAVERLLQRLTDPEPAERPASAIEVLDILTAARRTEDEGSVHPTAVLPPDSPTIAGRSMLGAAPEPLLTEASMLAAQTIIEAPIDPTRRRAADDATLLARAPEGGAPEGGAPEGGAPEGGAPEGGDAEAGPVPDAGPATVETPAPLMDDLPELAPTDVHSVEPALSAAGPLEYLSSNDSTEEHRTIRARGGEAPLPAETPDATPADPPRAIASDANPAPPEPSVLLPAEPPATAVIAARKATRVPAVPPTFRDTRVDLVPARPSRAHRLGRWGLRNLLGVPRWAWVLVLTVVGLGAWTMIGAHEAPAAPPVFIRADNFARITSVPSGAEVMAERDGQLLGATPLTIMAAASRPVALLLTAPGHLPVRLIVPDQGEVRVTLPAAPTDYCEVDVRTVDDVSLREHRGRQSVPGTVAVAGGAVFRREGVGRRVGARVVRCRPSGAPPAAPLQLQPAARRRLQITGEPGLEVSVDGAPARGLPATVHTEKALVRLVLLDGEGGRHPRWVAVPADAVVALTAPTPTPPTPTPPTPTPPTPRAPTAAPDEVEPPAALLPSDGSRGRSARNRRVAARHYRQGRRAMSAKRNITARNAFRRCLKADRRYPECHRDLGTVYRRLNQGRRAASHFRRYLELRPKARDAARVRRFLDESLRL